MYGCQIKTTSGDMVIDYRNESNGGNLCWDDEPFYGGVFGQNVSTMNRLSNVNHTQIISLGLPKRKFTSQTAV